MYCFLKSFNRQYVVLLFIDVLVFFTSFGAHDLYECLIFGFLFTTSLYLQQEAAAVLHEPQRHHDEAHGGRDVDR